MGIFLVLAFPLMFLLFFIVLVLLSMFFVRREGWWNTVTEGLRDCQNKLERPVPKNDDLS